MAKKTTPAATAPAAEQTQAAPEQLAAAPTTPPETQPEQPAAQDASETAVVYDTPAPTMVNGVYVGPKAEAKPERSLYERINEAFPNARQTAVLSELVNRLIVLEAQIFGAEDGSQK